MGVRNGKGPSPAGCGMVPRPKMTYTAILMRDIRRLVAIFVCDSYFVQGKCLRTMTRVPDKEKKSLGTHLRAS